MTGSSQARPGLPTVALDGRVLAGPPAGIGYYTRSILAGLARSGRFRLVVYCHRPPHDVEDLATAGVEFVRLRSPIGWWWQQRTLPRRLRRDLRKGRGADLFWSPVATLPRELEIPSVVTVHDLTPLLFPYWHSWRNRVTFKRHLPASLDTAAHIIVDSAATGADLERRFPWTGSKQSVIHLGVDPEFRPTDPSRIAAIRRSFGAEEGYALFVGTLEPRKNLPTLLDAWQQVQEKLPRTPPLLVAGGRGWRSGSVRRRLARAPGVRYLGRLPRKRMIEAMQGATAFVYPSLYEGFGLPVLEAMACGVPVVTSDRSSLPEVVGEAGFQVHPQHASKLAAAVRKVLEDEELRRRLSARGIARAATFDWDATVEATAGVFDRVLAGEFGRRRRQRS